MLAAGGDEQIINFEWHLNTNTSSDGSGRKRAHDTVAEPSGGALIWKGAGMTEPERVRRQVQSVTRELARCCKVSSKGADAELDCYSDVLCG